VNFQARRREDNVYTRFRQATCPMDGRSTLSAGGIV
jgi:hypothetical protein